MIVKRYDEIDELEYMDYISEWEETGKRIVPFASRRDGLDFEELQKKWKGFEDDSMYEKKLVPATIYFLVEDSGRIIGTIDVRHELNDYLRSFGGNIGYGIRPTERRMGYGSMMLRLVLEKIDYLDQVLITCDDDNIGSAKIIESCGGVLENKVAEGDKVVRRYWIKK